MLPPHEAYFGVPNPMTSGTLEEHLREAWQAVPTSSSPVTPSTAATTASSLDYWSSSSAGEKTVSEQAARLPDMPDAQRASSKRASTQEVPSYIKPHFHNGDRKSLALPGATCCQATDAKGAVSELLRVIAAGENHLEALRHRLVSVGFGLRTIYLNLDLSRRGISAKDLKAWIQTGAGGNMISKLKLPDFEAICALYGTVLSRKQLRKSLREPPSEQCLDYECLRRLILPRNSGFPETPEMAKGSRGELEWLRVRLVRLLEREVLLLKEFCLRRRDLKERFGINSAQCFELLADKGVITSTSLNEKFYTECELSEFESCVRFFARGSRDCVDQLEWTALDRLTKFQDAASWYDVHKLCGTCPECESLVQPPFSSCPVCRVTLYGPTASLAVLRNENPELCDYTC